MLTETAKTILLKRYVIKNELGEPVETPDELFRRVARAVAINEQTAGVEDAFYQMMVNLDFLPNSPTLMNAGTGDGQLSACFVLPVEDSMDSIFTTLHDMAIIHKSGGGTGFSFSKLRATDAAVKSTGGVASGPISFMSAYDAATETIKQGGKRRGANMGMLRVDHPDILQFIDCKMDLTKLSNFNISVAITDKFMVALENNTSYDMVNPATGKIVGSLMAKYVWDKIIHNSWKSAEPGVFFIDKANAINPIKGETFETTNPCGEQPLMPYESCNLGSINLANMVKDGEIDWAKLEYTTRLAVHFLDNVIDVNKYPLTAIEERTRQTRKIGLGVMGWADMLLLLGLPYNSSKALSLADKVMGLIDNWAKQKSIDLAKERGPFPMHEYSIFPYKMRNAAVTTIAPTGTISMIAGVSSGIEPIFGFAYTKNVMDGAKFIEVNSVLEETLRERGLLTPGIVDAIAATGIVSHVIELPADIRELFVCAHDIAPADHVLMQATFQKHVDNAISKTVNFPRTATIADFDAVYRLAYATHCKGITAYRDGSRDSQVLTMGTTQETELLTVEHSEPRVRSKVLRGFTEKVATGCGNLYVTLNFDDQGMCEVLTNAGKSGGCHAQSEASARLATLALRSNVDYDAIIRQLKGVRCPSAMRSKKSECLSCPDAISKVLRKGMTMLGDGDALDLGICMTSETIVSSTPVCPECGAPVEFAEGCITCPSCGFSKCN